jgi:ABC-type phosphate transport system substrate-binding protein
MMRFFVWSLTLILAVGMLVWPSPAQSGDVIIVAHPDVAVNSVSREELSKIFLHKVRRWQDGTAIEVFDLEPRHPIREVFSRAVHERSTSSIKGYWQRIVFGGKGTAPEELNSEDEVLATIRSTPGAVGYVSRGKALSGVKTIAVSG